MLRIQYNRIGPTNMMAPYGRLFHVGKGITSRDPRVHLQGHIDACHQGAVDERCPACQTLKRKVV
jgi:hypothetical protein